MTNEDCISRTGLKKRLQEHHDFFMNAYGDFYNLQPDYKSRVDEINNCIAEVVNMPSVRPEQKIAHLIFTDKCNEHAKCSNCGYGGIDLMIGEIHNFCQCCGAKFEGKPEPYKETE